MPFASLIRIRNRLEKGWSEGGKEAASWLLHSSKRYCPFASASADSDGEHTDLAALGALFPNDEVKPLSKGGVQCSPKVLSILNGVRPVLLEDVTVRYATSGQRLVVFSSVGENERFVQVKRRVKVLPKGQENPAVLEAVRKV